MKIQLSTSSFKLMEKGPNTLKIVEAKPCQAVNPKISKSSLKIVTEQQ